MAAILSLSILTVHGFEELKLKMPMDDAVLARGAGEHGAAIVSALARAIRVRACPTLCDLTAISVRSRPPCRNRRRCCCSQPVWRP